MAWSYARTAAAVIALLALETQAALAQTARSGGGASAQLMQQMQQLASERTSLQAENAKLKKDLDDIRKERDALQSSQKALDVRAKSSAAAISALKESVAQRESSDRELTRAKEKLQQLVSKFRETLQTLHDVETEGTATKQTLATRDRALAVCVDRNLTLYQINQEILTRLEHQNLWTRTAQTEPFTRIKRTQLENLVDEYKSRADDQRTSSPGAAKPTDAPAGSAPLPQTTPH
jgi:chromosome segregation ATPase